MKATCQCGQVDFTLPEPGPTVVYVCHCTECRHQSASAYGISAMYGRVAIEEAGIGPSLRKMIDDGQVKVWERITATGRRKLCLFCANCGVRLLHMGYGEEKDEKAYVSMKGGCLDGLTKEMLKDAVHIWTKSTIVEIPAGVQQYEEEPNE